MSIRQLVGVVSVAVLSACSAPHLDPKVQETRKVSALTDEQKTVTVPEGMVWTDAEPPRIGIRFVEGTYVLEAEDEAFLYFRSERGLDVRVFKAGKLVDGRILHGGLMLGKNLVTTIPAAGYIDGERDGEKIMIWKLGREFLAREDVNWSRSFASPENPLRATAPRDPLD